MLFCRWSYCRIPLSHSMAWGIVAPHQSWYQWCIFSKPVYFFSIENAKFWPSILVNFGYFVANLRTFGCTEIDRYIRYAPPLHIITTLQFSKLITFPSGPWQLCQLQRLRANGNNPKNRPDLDWSGYWIRCLHRSNYSTIQPLTVIGQNFYPILTST